MSNPIEEANAFLGAALAQSIPSDDKIIIGHLRSARELLNRVHETLEDNHGAEVGWVIEREDSEPSRPMYYAGKEWDHDNLKAVRFARREDAQTMCRYMFPGEPHRIADHMWCDYGDDE